MLILPPLHCGHPFPLPLTRWSPPGLGSFVMSGFHTPVWTPQSHMSHSLQFPCFHKWQHLPSFPGISSVRPVQIFPSLFRWPSAFTACHPDEVIHQSVVGNFIITFHRFSLTSLFLSVPFSKLTACLVLKVFSFDFQDQSLLIIPHSAILPSHQNPCLFRLSASSNILVRLYKHWPLNLCCVDSFLLLIVWMCSSTSTVQASVPCLLPISCPHPHWASFPLYAQAPKSLSLAFAPPISVSPMCVMGELLDDSGSFTTALQG